MIRFTASVGPLGVRGVDGGEHFGEEFAGQARGGDLAVGVSVDEPVEEAFLAACVERSGEQQPADAIERVTTAPRWPSVSFCTRRRTSLIASLARRMAWK